MINLVSYIPQELVYPIPQYPQNLVYCQGYEQWDMINYKDICPNMYAISTYGRIMNIQSNIILKQHISNSGYYAVVLRTTKELYNGRKCGTFLVHRLMMITFQPILNYNQYTVNHHDCDKLNNDYYNLEWMTQAENNAYKYTTHTDNHTGELCSNTVINSNEARIICEELEKGTPYEIIAEILGKEHMPNIYSIINSIKYRRAWKHISKDYDFGIDDTYHPYNNTSKYTRKETEYICKCIGSGYTIKEIYESMYHKKYLGCKRKETRSFYETVMRIKHKRQATDISDKYF